MRKFKDIKVSPLGPFNFNDMKISLFAKERGNWHENKVTIENTFSLGDSFSCHDV